MQKFPVFLVFCFIFVLNIFGQETCLTPQEAEKIIKSMSAPLKGVENGKLRQELLKMQQEREKLYVKVSQNFENNKSLIPKIDQLGAAQLLRVCRIIKENGWLTESVIKQDGLNALGYLIVNNKACRQQWELFPVLVEAAKKDYFKKSYVALIIDSLRLARGLPQIFGTQAAVRNDAVYIHPLLNDAKVDEWRKIYELPPLRSQIREFELRFFLPVLKSNRLSLSPNLEESVKDKQSEIAALGISESENETIKVGTSLVNLNLRILNKNLTSVRDLTFTKNDFTISEEGKEREIKFFSTAETSFNLVLILDFSGSTMGKRDLIKRAAQRFVEYARPSDKISVIAFASQIQIISELTSDKQALKQKIQKIDLTGGSAIWESIRFAYDDVLKNKGEIRRNAIVIMTDGIDGSGGAFADLLETVRNEDTVIFPVYVDTSKGYVSHINDGFRRLGRRYLRVLAEESGGELYHAKDLKDLDGVYEQIIDEVGKIYSIAYEPENEIRDGGWRSVKVKIKNRPDLIVKTKSGYYAK